MTQVARGVGPGGVSRPGVALPIRIHDLLLSLAGRLDDDALADARQMLASAELDRSLEFLAGCVAAGSVVLTADQHRELESLFADTYLDSSVIDRVPMTDRGAAGRHRFAVGAVDGREPDRGVADAVRPVLDVLPDVRSMWCVWRLTPAGPASGPVPHLLVLVGIGPGGFPPATAYRVEHALRRAGIRASVEVLVDGVEPGEYHREAMRNARQVPFDGLGSSRRVEPMSFDMPRVELARAEPSRIEPPRMAPTRVEPPRVESRVEPPRMEPTRVELPRVEVPVEPPRVETPRVEPPRVEPPRVEPPRVEPYVEVARAEPARVEPPMAVEPPPVEPPRVEPPRVEPPRVEPPRVEPPRMEAPRMEPPPIDAPHVEQLPVRKAPPFAVEPVAQHSFEPPRVDPPTMMTPAAGGLVSPEPDPVASVESPEPIAPAPPVEPEVPRVDAVRSDPFTVEPSVRPVDDHRPEPASPFEQERMPEEERVDLPPSVLNIETRTDSAPSPRRRADKPKDEQQEPPQQPRLAPAGTNGGTNGANGRDKHSAAFVDDILNTQERNLLRELQDELARREQQEQAPQSGSGAWRVDRSGRHGKPAGAGPFDNQTTGPMIINGVPPHPDKRGYPPAN